MFLRRNRGFALLFVLIVASILALSIGILCTQNYITNLRTQREISEQQARYGALFALNSAVARLQKFAGNDNVISAKANNFNGELQLQNNALRHVDGLWKIVKNGSRYFTKFLCWLSSQKDSCNFENVKITYSSEQVCLIKNSQYSLQIPKRQIKFSGREDEIKWAFIIEDESQKIDLSLVDRGKNLHSKNTASICAQLPNIEALTTFSLYEPNLKIYPYIDFPEQFSLINPDLGKQILNQNLCTLHSYGIWAGPDGLKRELNHFLSTNKFSDTDTIFEPQPTCAILPPTWKMLRFFVQQAQRIQNNSIKIQPFVPICRPQYLQNYPDNSTSYDVRVPSQYGIYPVLTQVLFDIAICAENEYLTLKFYPKFVLWNPYNLTLQLSDYQIDTNIFPQQPDDQIAITIVAKPQNPQTAQVVQTVPLCNEKIRCYLKTFWSTNFSASFAPGEVKTFSLQKNYNLSDIGISRSVPGSYKNCFILKTDLKISDFSDFTLSLTDQNGMQNRNWNSWYFRLNCSDQICQEIAQVSHNQSVTTISPTFQPTDREKVLFSFTAYLKTISPKDIYGDTGVHWLQFANPRAPYINRALFQDPVSLFFGQNFIPGNWSWQLIYRENAASLNLEQINFLSRLVLFEIPDMPDGLENLATLRHMNWAPFGYLPAYTFGNSNANPYIPLNATFVHHAPAGIWPTHANVEALFDYAYLLNEKLFDNFFCVPQNNFHNYPGNQRVKQLYPAQNISAENALIKGAFNVHTTEVEPWLAYLSAISTPDKKAIFPRISSSINSGDSCPKFSYEMVKKLAQNIVDLIMQRKCFPTLSAFINRQPDGQMQHCGLVQQAINDSRLNASTQRNYIKFTKNKPWFEDSTANTYLETGLPNVGDQADVLQTIAHFITTRGDTFKITAYGEYCANNKICKKKCEAIVQRFPEFVNTRENAPHDTELSAINQALGRRFKIILFRWCN